MRDTEVRRFHAHETTRMQSLDGLPLAAFWQRVLGYSVDLCVAVAVWLVLEILWHRLILHQESIHALNWDFHEKSNIAVMLVYWGVCNYAFNGQTPGSG